MTSDLLQYKCAGHLYEEDTTVDSLANILWVKFVEIIGCRYRDAFVSDDYHMGLVLDAIFLSVDKSRSSHDYELLDAEMRHAEVFCDRCVI